MDSLLSGLFCCPGPLAFKFRPFHRNTGILEIFNQSPRKKYASRRGRRDGRRHCGWLDSVQLSCMSCTSFFSVIHPSLCYAKTAHYVPHVVYNIRFVSQVSIHSSDYISTGSQISDSGPVLLSTSRIHISGEVYPSKEGHTETLGCRPN